MQATLSAGQDLYTKADVARIVAAAVAQVARTAGQPKSYTLHQVAEMTGMSWRKLADGCRSGSIVHVQLEDGGRRVMTEAQIDKLLADNTRSGSPTSPVRPADELAQAVQRSRRSQTRQTPRRLRGAA